MITAKNLVKKFGEFVAVDAVEFSVAKGEVMALLGPNGAGKTTTIRMLTSILKPTSGSARVNGFDVVEQTKEVRASVGVLTENHGLYNRMPADEYLEFFGQMYGVSKNTLKNQIDQLLDQFGLTKAAKQRIGEYSKGMRQKLSLARSLLHNPPVLLLDEPTSAMDPESARLVRNMIMELATNERTILICTHNLSEAEVLADKIAIIQGGRIIENGTTSELRKKLLGSPHYEIHFAHEVDEIDKRIYDLVDDVQIDQSILRYACDHPEKIHPMLLQLLIDQGQEVVFIKEVSQSLEKLYLQAINLLKVLGDGKLRQDTYRSGQFRQAVS